MKPEDITLDIAAEKTGASYQRYTTEAGGVVIVTIHRQNHHFSHEHGDPLTAAQQAVDFLAEVYVTAAQRAADPSVVEMQGWINTGTVWRLEGHAGREAMRMMEAGLVMLGREPNRDYWGNFIPARTQVAYGTKGSALYAMAQLLTAEEE